MENVVVDETPAEALKDVLERDHREIDDALEGYADGSVSSTHAQLGLKRAVNELRRHIYAEEELLFPALRDAGMTGPILVMLREHGQMWAILDTLDEGLVDGAGDEVMRSACRELLLLLQDHNPKEELILYPQVDRVVGENASVHVRELLDSGQVPAGWVCQHQRSERDRRPASPHGDTGI